MGNCNLIHLEFYLYKTKRVIKYRDSVCTWWMCLISLNCILKMLYMWYFNILKFYHSYKNYEIINKCCPKPLHFVIYWTFQTWSSDNWVYHYIYAIYKKKISSNSFTLLQVYLIFLQQSNLWLFLTIILLLIYQVLVYIFYLCPNTYMIFQRQKVIDFAWLNFILSSNIDRSNNL